jgi:hypothetical protein
LCWSPSFGVCYFPGGPSILGNSTTRAGIGKLTIKSCAAEDP